MENDSSKVVSYYEFLEDRNTGDLFAKIDYFLKDGMHIQRDYPSPSQLYRYIESNYESLKSYYIDIFKVVLSQGGNEFNRYYYLDFEDGNRSNIPSDQRETLKTEYIIIGMLFFKFYKIDGNLELDKVTDFTRLLFQEYEEEKEALSKLIADATSDKSSDFNDEKIKEVIKKAFSKFHELGWIAWEDNQEKDRFIYLPSFERLREMYQSQIIGIDDLIKAQNNE